MQRRRSQVHWVVFAAVAALVFSGTALPASQSDARTNATPKWVTTAKQRLAKLDVNAPASMTGYQPRVESFGPSWYDVDLNGCDTRNDILDRDLKQVVLKGSSKCKVATGTLNDPYTGKTIKFVQADAPLAVQIDHVVALAAAWRTGAKKWSGEHRLFYANDPLVLLAADGPANNAKGDSDAAEWLPAASFQCRYVARQVAIKTKFELWVTPPEREAMTDVLTNC